MRTGADYCGALRDGRRVWVMGEGRVADVTTHPATRAMVEEYAAWYDRHFDPAWQDILLSPYEVGGAVGGLGGLIMVHMRRAAALISARTCPVSVDFGTTNTMLTMRIGDDNPLQQIDTQVWLPRNISGSAADRADFRDQSAPRAGRGRLPLCWRRAP